MVEKFKKYGIYIIWAATIIAVAIAGNIRAHKMAAKADEEARVKISFTVLGNVYKSGWYRGLERGEYVNKWSIKDEGNIYLNFQVDSVYYINKLKDLSFK